MPDNELLRLASRNALRRPRILEAQVKRMLRDPRSRALAQQFASQWLQTRKLAPYKPETLTDYEIGAKSSLFGDTLLVDGSVFYYDYRDLQAQTFTNVGAVALIKLSNIQTSSIYGLDLGANLRDAILNPSQHITAGYAPIMPTYQGQISEDGLIDLVEYIKGLQTNYRVQQTLTTSESNQAAPTTPGAVKP